MLHIYLIYCPNVKNALIYRMQYPVYVYWYLNCVILQVKGTTSSSVLNSDLNSSLYNRSVECKLTMSKASWCLHIRDNSFCDWATKTIFHIADIPWLVLCVANGLCLLIAHQLCWERIGQRGEERGRDYGLWMVEVSMKFCKISQYSERGSPCWKCLIALSHLRIYA